MAGVTDPLATVAWPVRTDRLWIRRATADDLDDTWEFRSLPEVGEWLSRAPTTKEAYADQFGHEGRLAATLVYGLHEGPMVGDLMLRVEDAWAQVEVAERAAGTQAELGWVLHPTYAGRGLATEAVGELLRVCFEDLGVRRVVANCFADNIASWRLMERLGMRREMHTVSESLHRGRGWVDGLGYAILADEWRAEHP
jgi:RimJ/RimL family protein N-acetyltransferase